MAEDYSYLRRKQMNRNYHKYDKEPERVSSNSIYFPVAFFSHNQVKSYSQKSRKNYGAKQKVNAIYNEYMIEIDADKTKEPHFHVWRANSTSKISNSRSKGISLLSSENNGLHHELLYTEDEERGGNELLAEQNSEFIPFVDEHRFVLFLIYEGMKEGKIKEINNFDEEIIKSLFTKRELDKLIQKFNLKYNEINNQSARE